ncbi:hypothetical protein M408DRAFT_334240 [Serendipita vermifera MAFF 305830]|uniref:NB-ARC domain-containing protein n=1 Tax=Serendipita vermifera MAFF 305830 TaxID=933852 RepID=A0A0C2VZY6_SERVB|nr:hypothetical protein M408DRAFT_334240 [Serendipita vermifera MAFF 305830]
MSLPSYFLPTKIGPPRRQQSFVGGVLGSNNPTRLLLDEASKIYGKDRRVAQIISLGCGLPRVLSVDSSDNESVDKLLKEVAADCEVVANELSTRLFNIDAYLRLNVNRGMETIKMQEWHDLGTIEGHTASHLALTAVSEALDSSLRCLVGRVGTVSLAQFNHISSIKALAKKAPPVSPYFVLRQKPWNTMINNLVISPSSRQKIFPITGMGGCGKTQLVSYFLREYPDSYAQTIYVDASSSPSIKADLQLWARDLGTGHERDEWEDAMRALNSAPHGEQWILILDNADDPDLNLTPFLPTNPRVTIMITSRNHALGNLSTTAHLELGEMTTDEALAAMLQAARRQLPLCDEEMHSAQDLLKELGCLAVALVQAGTYCRQLSSTIGDVYWPYTFTQYLRTFRSHRADLMNQAEPVSLDNYQRGVHTTLDLSYKVLPQECRDVLHILSQFHYVDIPLSAFTEAAKNGFADPYNYYPRDDSHKMVIYKLKDLLYKDGEWNELHLQGIIRKLRSFSLVMASSMDNSLFLQLHPLVQAWSRDMSIMISQPYREMAIQVLTACGSEIIKLNRLLFLHITDMMNQEELQSPHINDLMAFGHVTQQQGHYRKAGELFEGAMRIMKSSTQATFINTLTVMFCLASSYDFQGLWTESEKLKVEVLEQRRRILGIEHPDTIIAAANLALTYHNQGRWSESEKLFVEVLEQRRRILGIEHPYTILAAGNLAWTYRSQGRWSESEKLEVEVLEQRRRILGIEHPDTILAAANLASTYYSQGRWSESEKLEVEVLEQLRRILGIEHPDTILAASNLAATYGAQGRWEEGAALLASVVQAGLKVLGQHHPHAQAYIRDLAFVYENLGRMKEAQETRTLLISDTPAQFTSLSQHGGPRPSVWKQRRARFFACLKLGRKRSAPPACDV